MKNLLLLLFLCTSVIGWAQTPLANQKKPKNIILLIGDGMGLSQVSAGFYFNDETSNFERFTNIGLIKSSSSAELVTDSAAGATAFASGVKSYNGAVGVDSDTNSVPTIIELLSKRNYATGVISTSSVVHATPAAFYAHVFRRSMYEAIAENLAKSEVDFIAGGGSQFFDRREDGKDLFEDFRKNNFEIHTESLPDKVSKKKQLILLADNAMPKMIEGRGNFLPESTQLGIDYLSANKQGFFLVVEGSQIDWGGHGNEADYLIGEQLDFDKTIGVALDFAKKNGETLVIVTADHETGGFTLAASENDYNTIKPSFSTGGHSATLIPVFAYGPGASSFNGIYENTEIFHKMMSLLQKK